MKEERSSAPGTCADCGNDAYIRLTGENGSAEMLCAHCFADRARIGKLSPPRRASAHDRRAAEIPRPP